MDTNSGSPDWERWPHEHQTSAAARNWLAALPSERRDGIRITRTILCLRPVDRIWPVDKAQSLRFAPQGCVDGRYPVRRQPLQRRCLGQPRDFRSRLERRCAARANVQTGFVHREMGTELGRATLPLERAPQDRLRLVAAARGADQQYLPSVSHRPRAGFLSHLRFPVAAATQWGIREPHRSGSGEEDGRPAAAFLSRP